MAPLESGLHFGHYIAGVDSDLISYCHTLLVAYADLISYCYTLLVVYAAVRWGYSPARLVAGCSLVEKMQTILLLEADFNFTNKMIYGDRMLANSRRYGCMAEEIFIERGRTTENGSLAKVLSYDIVRQFWLNVAIASVDAANCYMIALRTRLRPFSSKLFCGINSGSESTSSVLPLVILKAMQIALSK